MYFSPFVVIPENLVRMKRVVKRIVTQKFKASNETAEKTSVKICSKKICPLTKADNFFITFSNGVYSFHEITSRENNHTFGKANYSFLSLQNIAWPALFVLIFLATVVTMRFILLKIHGKNNEYEEEDNSECMLPNNTTEVSSCSLNLAMEKNYKSRNDLELGYDLSDETQLETGKTSEKEGHGQQVQLLYEENQDSSQTTRKNHYELRASFKTL